MDGFYVCPTEAFPQSEVIILNEYFVETWLGDDSKITMDMWNVYIEYVKWTNNYVEGWNSKFAKVVGKYLPNIFHFMVAKHDAAIPPP